MIHQMDRIKLDFQGVPVIVRVSPGSLEFPEAL
jgi:hypothetical protein